jgi:hypothetical protein
MNYWNDGRMIATGTYPSITMNVAIGISNDDGKIGRR